MFILHVYTSCLYFTRVCSIAPEYAVLHHPSKVCSKIIAPECAAPAILSPIRLLWSNDIRGPVDTIDSQWKMGMMMVITIYGENIVDSSSFIGLPVLYDHVVKMQMTSPIKKKQQNWIVSNVMQNRC